VAAVLLVEDEPSVGELVRGYLARDGYHVLWVRSGEDALVELGRHTIRMVVLDIGLPGMDGYEVAQRIRAGANGAPPTLVALTGYGQQEDRQRAREAGFDHHFIKPADIAALQAAFAGVQPNDAASPR